MRYIRLLETAGPMKNDALNQDWLDKAKNLTELRKRTVPPSKYFSGDQVSLNFFGG